MIVCPGGYAAYKMQRRNEWMVDRSNVVAALWDGTDGGTANCVRYAIDQRVTVINLWGNWVRHGSKAKELQGVR